MSNLKKTVFAILLCGLVVMAAFSYFVYSTIFVPNTFFQNNEAHIYISQSDSFNDVVVEISPLLIDVESFTTVANKKGYSSNVKSGHYVIKKGMNNNEIINSIRTGNIPVKVKFNNQERIEDLAGTLAKQLDADSLSFLNAMLNENFLKENNFTKETALCNFIPNTYQLYWDITPENFNKKMLEEFNRFWNKNRLEKVKKNKIVKKANYQSRCYSPKRNCQN
jgi:UPF0755 protein